MKNNIKNNPDFLAMVEVMKDNAHCPAHRNCEKCVYATDDTMCSLMIKAEKLIKAGFRYQLYDVGDTVYVAMKWLPTPKRMKITDIHYCKFSRGNCKWIQCQEYKTGATYTFAPDDFGKEVFLLKKDAEKAIRQWKNSGLR